MRTRLAGFAAAIVAAFAIGAPAAHAAEPETRIVGGGPANIAQVPWQVALADSQAAAPGDNGFERQFCGGTLVAPTVVITAAHCVYSFTLPTGCSILDGFNTPASDLAVFTGRTVLSSTQGQEINVAEVYYFVDGGGGAPALEAQSSPGQGNELYSCETDAWDVAILKLPQPSTTGTPIKIAGADEAAAWAPGEPALISGWGTTLGDGQRFSRRPPGRDRRDGLRRRAAAPRRPTGPTSSR